MVDDDFAVREALACALKTENYHVVTATNGEAAVREFSTNPIDIALLDLNLGKECGWDVFRQLIEIHPFLPIIIISAEPEKFAHPSAQKAGALMEKPLNLSALFNTLNKFASESPEGLSHRTNNISSLAEDCVVNDI